MLNLEQIKRELKKYNFAYEENVLPVHANGHYFLYGFYEKGIAIFALRPDWTIDEGALLPWGDVLSLKVKKSLLFENTYRYFNGKDEYIHEDHEIDGWMFMDKREFEEA